MKKVIAILLVIVLVLLNATTAIAAESAKSSSADVTAPTVVEGSLQIDNTKATIGDTVKISVEVTDDKSGVDSVTIYYDPPTAPKLKYIDLAYNENTKKYEGTIEITDDWESGTWRISFITTADKQGNQIDLWNSNKSSFSPSQDLSVGDFAVYGTNADAAAPTVVEGSLQVDNTKATIGDTVKISVEVTDDKSEVDSVTIYYDPPTAPNLKYINLAYNENTKKYEGTIEITDDWESGTWRISFITTADKQGNQIDLWNSNKSSFSPSQDLSAGDFAVYGTNADAAAPTVVEGSLQVDTPEVAAGDTVKISVEVTDDKSGVDSVTIYYDPPTAPKLKYINLAYNENTKKYEGTIEITDDWESGTWRISFITTADKQGNYISLRNSNTTNLTPSQDLSAGDFTVLYDKKAPGYINGSLHITNTDLTKDDTTTISLSATDEHGISSVKAIYEKPGSKDEYTVNLSAKGNDIYAEDFAAGQYTESGTWKIKKIVIADHYNNVLSLMNRNIYTDHADAVDLSAGDFTVTGTETDIDPPEIDLKSLTVNHTSLTTEQVYAVSMKVTDKVSGVDSVVIKYITPQNKTYELKLKEDAKNIYKGTISYSSLEDLGEWTVHSIEIMDNAGNKKTLKSGIETASFEFYNELDQVAKISGVTVYKENAYISSQTIDGDIYIGPKAVVTLSNVTVNGNIYVLGGARLMRIAAEGVYGSNFSIGYGTQFYNGTVYWSGNCSIGTMSASSYPVTAVPYQIENNRIRSVDGILKLKGATLDIADFYVNDQQVKLSDDGKFVIKEIKIGDADTILLKWVTVFGNTITKKLKVDKCIAAEDGTIHHRPSISASNQEIPINSNYDLLKSVKAYDEEDGDLSKKVTVDKGNFDITKRGTYTVTYTVMDSNGATAKTTAEIKVVEPKITKIEFDDNNITKNCDAKSVQLIAKVVEQDNPSYRLNWSSSNKDVAEVDQNGLVSIKSAGKTNIIVSAEGVEASCQIIIVHNWSERPAVDQEATCSEEGSQSIHCLNCDAVKDNQIIPAKGHSWEKDATIDKAATCTEAGSKSVHCEVCNSVKERETIPAIGHNYKNVTVAATMSANGSVSTICSRCRTAKNKVIIYKPIKFTLSTAAYTYNGKVKAPSVTVKNAKGTTLGRNIDYTVSYGSGRKAVGKYSAKVTFKGKYKGTKSLYFRINPKGTSISKLTKGNKKFTVKWKKQTTQTTGYQLMYSTSSKFKSGNKTVTISKNKTTTKTISRLKAKKKYYVKARTYKTVKGVRYYSGWSKAKSVKTR